MALPISALAADRYVRAHAPLRALISGVREFEHQAPLCSFIPSIFVAIKLFSFIELRRSTVVNYLTMQSIARSHFENDFRLFEHVTSHDNENYQSLINSNVSGRRIGLNGD